MILRLRVEAEDGLPPGTPDAVMVETWPFRIGREPPAQLVLPDPTRAVSAVHCEIARDGDAFVLHDHSTNGTFVNGGARLREPHRLAEGDRLQVGRYMLVAELAGTEADSDRTVIMAPRRAVPRLHITVQQDPGIAPPPRTEASIEGDGSLVIGRGQDAGLVLPDLENRVSRRHCELTFAGGVCTLTDLSANGTLHEGSGERLANGTALKSGDRLRLGPYILSLSVSGVSASGPKAEAAVAPMPPPAPPRRGGDPAAMAAAAPEPSSVAQGGPAAGELTMIARPIAVRSPPRPVAPPLPVAAPAAAAAAPPELLERLAKAIGMAPADLGTSDAVALAEQLATIAGLCVELLHELLNPGDGRSRSMAPQGNNPLEVFADKTSALRALFGPPQRLFLDPVRAVRTGIEDVRHEQERLRSAANTAVSAYAGRLSPEKIAAAAGKKKLLGSHKAHLWDHYLEAWAEVQRDAPGR